MSDRDRARLANFYVMYQPLRSAEDVDFTIRLFEGKESLLFELLVKKYGPEPPFTYADTEKEKTQQQQTVQKPQDGAATAATSFDAKTKARLTRFYEKYSPDHLPFLKFDECFRAYIGKEDVLFDELVKKFGPEPPFEEQQQQQVENMSMSDAPHFDD